MNQVLTFDFIYNDDDGTWTSVYRAPTHTSQIDKPTNDFNEILSDIKEVVSQVTGLNLEEATS